ncbi:MAG: S41 family peptidase, partial [Bryobacteraceae bacterium]
QDSHSSFAIYSSLTYSTGLHADIYDSKAVIDSINRLSLPVSRFPFQIGDEIVLVNGRPVDEAIEANVPLVASANVWARRRVALGRLFSGGQSNNPAASNVGDTVEVTVKSRTTGAEQAYSIPVVKSGVPLSEGGNTPSPVFKAAGDKTARKAIQNDEPDDYFPPWVTALAPLQDAHIQTETDAVLSFGSRPGFTLPAGFVQRQGRLSSDEYFSGTFNSGTTRIGYLRIPTFTSKNSATTALRQFETEIQFFNDNTDGLILDVMRNPGGNACYTEEMLRRLIPGGFRAMQFEIRASYVYASFYKSAVDSLTAAGAPPQLVAQYQAFLDEVIAASNRPRGRTTPLSICSESPDRTAATVVYRKPVVVLVDEFSASASDAFAAVFQDARRGPIFGFRSNGAGGTVQGRESGPYSEFYSQTTLSLMYRPTEVAISGYPVTHYVENVGVWPDVPYNFMSLDNLLGGGIPFRDGAIATLLSEIAHPR